MVPPEKWGPYFWGVLHLGCLAGSITPEFIAMYPAVIPCGMCGQHFAELIQENPFPDSTDPLVLFKWSVDAHNIVNERAGKPIISFEEAMAIWTSPIAQAPPPAVTQKPDIIKFDFKNVLIAVLILLLIFMSFKK